MCATLCISLATKTLATNSRILETFAKPIRPNDVFPIFLSSFAMFFLRNFFARLVCERYSSLNIIIMLSHYFYILLLPNIVVFKCKNQYINIIHMNISQWTSWDLDESMPFFFLASLLPLFSLWYLITPHLQLDIE